MNAKSNVTMNFDEICQWLGVETMDRFVDRCSYWDSNFPPEMTEEEVQAEIEHLEGNRRGKGAFLRTSTFSFVNK
jgi:hypothetical protein